MDSTALNRAIAVVVVGAMVGACETSSPPPPPTPTPTPGPQPTPVPTPVPTHAVDKSKELMITDRSVIESDLAVAPDGPWTFGRLFRDLSPRDSDAKAMLLAWVGAWDADRSLNGDTAPARPSIRNAVINPWKARDHPSQPDISDEEWVVNWNNAPFRLLAIVNRIDLRGGEDATPANAGEGRFMFCVHNNLESAAAGHLRVSAASVEPRRFARQCMNAWRAL